MPTALVGEIALGLEDPMLRGALVMGGAGIGKTQLGHALESALGAEYDVTWLIGQQLLADEPYAVFDFLLPNLESESQGKPAISGMNVVQMLYEQVQGAALARTPLLVVDNAQWVDENSCAVLEQLSASGTVKILLLCRPGHSSVAQSALFTDDTMLAQHVLPLLVPAQVLAVSEAKLGGKMVPGAAAVLAALSGGHPLFLHAILDAALEQEAFVRHGRVWALSAIPTDPAPNVSDVAMDMFREYPANERQILESVALAEPLSESLLHKIFPGNAHENLIAANVLRVTRGTAPTVLFVSPVFGQSLRQRIPVGRSIEIRRRVLAARASQPLSSDALMRHTGWSLDCGAPVRDRSLLHAARVANLRNEPRMALRLGSAVTEPHYLFQAQLESVLASIKLQLLPQGRELLDKLAAEVATQSECDSVGTLAVMLAAAQGFPQVQLEELARRWREAYLALGLESCAGADLVDALIVVKSGYFLPRQMRQRLLEIGGSASQVGLKFAATALLAHAGVVEGEHQTAERDFALARQLLVKHPGWLGQFRHVLTGQHMLFLAAVGAPGRALQLLEASRNEAQDHSSAEFYGLMELVNALAQRAQGNVVSAAAAFDVAIAALREADPVNVLPFALASAAYAHHLMGNNSTATALSKEFHAATLDDSAPMWLLSKSYLAAAASVSGSTERTFEVMHDLAEVARQQGAAAVEIAIHDVLLRAGCTDYLGRLLEIDIKPEGPAIPMLKTMAQGLLAQDVQVLELVAKMPEARENKMLAAEALSHALRLHIQQGNHEGRAGVLAQVRGMQFPFQAIGSLAIAELAATAELTVREKEIAVLVHNRYSNRDIAEKFTLSQRTIEGHLYKIYSKLGVGSRDELYEPWLSELLATPGK